MIRIKKYILIILSIGTLWQLISCKSEPTIDLQVYLTDTASIRKGEKIFTNQCTACHNFKQDGIGPQLGGLTREVNADWIKNFILNPQKIIQTKDNRAQKLFDKYHVYMPPFENLSPEEMDAILAFMHTHEMPKELLFPGDTNNLKNPIPDTIPLSTLILSLSQISKIPTSSDSGKLPLTRITKMDFEPHTGQNFILDLRGKLYKMNNGKASVYMDMALNFPSFIHKPGLATGFGSFAFHPEFYKNGLFYTTHTEPARSAKADFNYHDSIRVTLQWVISEWKTEFPTANNFKGKPRELFRVDMVSGIHGMQEIIFNPYAKPSDEDYALLYIGIGDGGAVEHGFPSLAHNLKTVWGTVLRIDPTGNNSKNGQYGIPAGNPFVKDNSRSALGEIFAYGFRNPHRITWLKDNKLLVSNVGHLNIESLYWITAGHDYGWPLTEGKFKIDPLKNLKKIYPLSASDTSLHISYPIAQYDHCEGKAISGGFEYLGQKIPKLKGKFLFGDIPTGRLFYIETSDIRDNHQSDIKEWQVSIDGSIKSLREICGTDRVDLHFGRDQAGEIYIMTKPDGKIYQIVN